MTTTRIVKGLLGKKLGMTQAWDANNKMVPITVIEAGSNVITQIKNLDTDGYTAIQIAYGAIDPRKVNKPDAGQFVKAGATPTLLTTNKVFVYFELSLRDITIC